MLGLIDEGDLKPTSGRIATRAGVSERTLFQHFPDREALFQGAVLAQAERISELFGPLPPTGAPLEARVAALAAERARVLEAVTPVRRAALQIEPWSETVASWLQAVREGAAAKVERLFEPELAGRGDRSELLAALITASTWPAWESMRAHQGLSPEAAEATMRHMLAALLGCR
jgi:AcrR family transcriptional regulator